MVGKLNSECKCFGKAVERAVLLQKTETFEEVTTSLQSQGQLDWSFIFFQARISFHPSAWSDILKTGSRRGQ